MAEEDVPRVRQGRSLFDAVADRRECPHLGRRVHHGGTGSRPSRPCAAAGRAAAAPAAPAARRRGVGRGRVRPVAAVAAVAAVATTTCGALRCRARGAMASYWCCASCHVADDTECHRFFLPSPQSDSFLGCGPGSAAARKGVRIAAAATPGLRATPYLTGAPSVIGTTGSDALPRTRLATTWWVTWNSAKPCATGA